MQGQLPAPTASGSLAKTPFPHLLVYALERRLTGSFELTRGNVSVATMVVAGGLPAKVRLGEPPHYLGNVLLELGMITQEQLQESLQRMQESPRLQGQILVDMGALTMEQLEAGLRLQVERKVEQLFGLSSDAGFHYYDGIDLLQGFGGPLTAIDPLPVLWRGIRQAPSWEHVEATLQRASNNYLRLSATAQIARFAFGSPEREAVERLRERPMRVLDITAMIGPALGQSLAYLLMILKQVDLVEAPPVSPQARPPAAAPPAGQAFARVQLQRQAARPLVVEEQVAPSSTYDERSSGPGTPPSGTASPPRSAYAPPAETSSMPDAQAPGTSGAEPVGRDSAISSPDIGALISQSIAPAAIGSPAPLVQAPPPAPLPSIPGVSPSTAPPAVTTAPEATTATSPPLTAEQNALKTKILERAEQISSQNYFQMLGVPHDAPVEAVQKAFIVLAKVWHPDRLPGALVDVKDACSKVFSHLTEAHATLTDPAKRQDYMQLLKEGGATPDDQARIQAILEAATEFQKAEILLKRNMNDPQAYALVKRCVSLDNEQPDYMATLAWLDAQKPEWQSREKTLEKVAVLDRCIQKNPNSERAHFYRAMLYKRIDLPNKAVKDFKRVVDLNPRNLDAAREVRLYHMRGGASRPPPSGGGSISSRPPQATKEGLGGLFDKLFKK